MIEQEKSGYAISFVCVSTIVITALTQVPSLSRFFKPIMYAMWVVTLFVGIARNQYWIPLNRFLIVYIIAIIVLEIECTVLHNTHSESYAQRIIPLPLMCYLAGYLIAQNSNENVAKKSLMAFFFVSFLMFTYIFISYVRSFSRWFNSDYYIYEQKNSAAQIIGCTIILTAFLVKPANRALRLGIDFALVFLFLIIVAIQCRTALISLLIVGAVYFFLILNGKKKVLFSFILFILILVVLNNDTLFTYVRKAFVFTERQTKSIDNFTSGRLSFFTEAWSIIKDNVLVGTGHYRVDNFYLCMLADVGLLGFAPVLTLWFFRIVINIAYYFRNKTPFAACMLCMTVFYLSESIFEAYPPFGPGVCAFMFWVACAYLDAKNEAKIFADKQQLNTESNKGHRYLK